MGLERDGSVPCDVWNEYLDTFVYLTSVSTFCRDLDGHTSSSHLRHLGSIPEKCMWGWWWADWRDRVPPVSTTPARPQFSILIFIYTVLQLQGQTDEASRKCCWGIRGALDREVLAWCVPFQRLILKSSRRLGRVKFRLSVWSLCSYRKSPKFRQHTKASFTLQAQPSRAEPGRTELNRAERVTIHIASRADQNRKQCS